MDFLANVSSQCEKCNGKRFNPEVLSIQYNGYSINDILNSDIDELLDIFKAEQKIHSKLSIISKIGIGYVQAGQPLKTLSGGEKQRVRLAKDILSPGKGKNLYLFDEPTRGLHKKDINHLIQLFEKLLQSGHTIIAIDHNPYFIDFAQHKIELGPGAGDKGGCLLY
jgi:excinuclease ABC subunit A